MTTSLTQRPGREDLTLNATPEQINALNRLVYRDSEPLPVELRDNPVYRRNLGLAAVRLGEGIINDVQKDVNIENLTEKIENLGLDALTGDLGIYNPNGFADVMERRDKLLWSNRAIDAVKPKGTLVIFIDGNDIGSINKAMGHDAGDKAIHVLADTICKNVRDEDIIGRRGGDEFVVVADIYGDDDEIAEKQSNEIVQRLKKALSSINDKETGLTSASVGVDYVVGPKISTAILEAVSKADGTMRQAKQKQKAQAKLN